MAINVDQARSQSAQLEGYAAQLSQARQQLLRYREEVAAGWQGQETTYLIQAINQAIARLDGAKSELNAISRDMVSAAQKIRAEEEAAARAAREAAAREAAAKEAAAREAEAKRQAQAAKNQRIRQAQDAYNQAVEQLNALQKEYESIAKKRDNTSSVFKKLQYMAQLAELAQAIAAAQDQCRQRKDALDAARR